MLSCQMSVRTDFVLTVVSHCLFFGYCSLVSSHRVITSAICNSNKPILPSPKYSSLPLLLQVLLAKGCSAKSGPVGQNRAVRWVNQDPQLGWWRHFLFLETHWLSTSVTHELPALAVADGTSLSERQCCLLVPSENSAFILNALNLWN